MFKNKEKRRKYNRGVSLIELLVVIAIFMIISSLTIFSYGDFKSSLSIQNLSDDIALSVRKAQNFATGSVGASGFFNYGYGLNFSTRPITVVKNDSLSGNGISSSQAGSSNKSFVFFVDRDGSGYYNDDIVAVCDMLNDPKCAEYIEKLSIKSNDYISGISLSIKDKEIPIKNNDYIDLLFKRPNPEPTFCYRPEGSSGCDDDSKIISSINITISSEKDISISKTITISNNGQISVDF